MFNDTPAHKKNKTRKRTEILFLCCLGPFLSALFSKMESMIQNSLYMNLLLTGIVARLAAYPQPLLRSFLLNHNLVFQPTVKSLVQVNAFIKSFVFSGFYLMNLKHFSWRKEVRKEGNVLFNDTLNTFYLRLYGVKHMVTDHSDSERENLLPPHRLLFPISSKCSFICTIPQTG